MQSISVAKLARLAEIDEATLRGQLALLHSVGQVVTWTRGDALQVRGAVSVRNENKLHSWILWGLVAADGDPACGEPLHMCVAINGHVRAPRQAGF
jgi:hypothetical protein